MSRQSWDEYFLDIAKLVASRSTCLRAQHGAVIVRDKMILSTGFNGAPRGLPHCTEAGECYRQSSGCAPGERYELCKSVHAEQNAIASAARVGASLDQSTLYITDLPCGICSKLLINAGVVKIVYLKTGRYLDRSSVIALNEGGLELIEIEQASPEGLAVTM